MDFELVDNADDRHVLVKPQGWRLSADLFVPQQDPAAARKLFADHVRHVVLEVSSYCNRRCGFCPNVALTRFKGEKLMPVGMFQMIISELAEISYQNTLYFHLYNEPLANAEMLIERITYARHHLPAAELAFNTNGDYLDGELLDRLDAAGCNQIHVSIYGPNHGQWNETYIRDRVADVAEKLGMSGALIEEPGISYRRVARRGRVKVFIQGRNLWKSGYDRGGLLPQLSAKRTSPCLSPVTEFLVDHRGWALPCCNVYTDKPEHAAYTVGHAERETIFEIYAGAAMTEWRRSLLKFNPGGDLCGNCSRMDTPGSDTPAAQQQLAQAKALLGVE